MLPTSRYPRLIVAETGLSKQDVPNTSVVWNWLHEWGLTRHKAAYFNRRKNTMDNTYHYLVVLTMLRNVDMSTLKFMDESHFRSKLLRPQYVYWKPNEQMVMQAEQDLDLKYSLSLMTSLAYGQPTVFYKLYGKYL